MAGFGQDEARLASLNPEPAGEQGGVLVAPVRRVGVHLGVQRLQLVRVRRRLRPVEQLERYAGRRYHRAPIGGRQRVGSGVLRARVSRGLTGSPHVSHTSRAASS